MAHVQMHQARDEGLLGAALEILAKRRNVEREIQQRERESKRSAGVSLQNTRSKLDTDLEIAKLRNRTEDVLTRFKAGIDVQLKQMGIDLETTLQKMRNFNAREIAEFNARAAQMLEAMRDENKQNQIVKEYQKQLQLANYDANTALYRTYLSVMGDIYKTGNPIDNAADSAAFGLWAIAFKLLYGNGTDVPQDLQYGDLGKKVDLQPGLNPTVSPIGEGETNEQINELIKVLKGEPADKGDEHRAPGSTISRYKEPGFRTKVRAAENKRAGRPWEKRDK